MGGFLRPSILATTILYFKKFWWRLKKIRFKKNSPSLYCINRNITHCYTLETIVADRRSPQKTGLGESICLSCGRASRGSPMFVTVVRRGRKFGGLLSAWQAAFLIFQRSWQLPSLSCKPQTQFFSCPGRGWGWVYFKEAKGWRITALKGTIRTIVNRSAVHVSGLGHSPICLFCTRFSCQCPFKFDSWNIAYTCILGQLCWLNEQTWTLLTRGTSSHRRLATFLTDNLRNISSFIRLQRSLFSFFFWLF
jgi:hypothetical protein